MAGARIADFQPLRGRRYRALAPIRAQLGTPAAGLFLEVPPGFEFDVSVPRGLRWLIDPHDPRFLAAAALHDFALHRLGWPREVAAAPFGHALRVARVSRLKRLAMVLAVIVWRWR